MNRFEEINKAFEALREKEKSKPKYQLILESINTTIVDVEKQLFRWKELKKTVTKNVSFTQLCGTFLFEYAILLKENAILYINHIIEENKDSINIIYFLNVIENERKRYIDDSKWDEAKEKITNHRLEVSKLKSEYISIIEARDKKIAHTDKKKLSNINNNEEIIEIEKIEELLKKITSIIDYYYELFDIKERMTLKNLLAAEESIGFNTGIKHLVLVVNLAFENLQFNNPEIQKIAKNYEYFK